MSRRSLAELGTTSIHHRLRSGPSCASLSVMEGDDRVGAEEMSVSQAADVQELREKLQMAQEELGLVRADLTRQLEQVQQTAGRGAGWPGRTTTASSADVQDSEGRVRETEVKGAGGERQLDGLARENKELWRQLQELEERTRTEVDALQLRLELEGLRQLEEVRKQFNERYAKFDRERDWYCE